jgi:ABC-2 type transport system ATP-binding protein
LSLAVGLGGRPDLLILDDPTSGLDPAARSWLQDELIRELADRESTILLATHDMDFAERVATHVTVLHGGAMQVHETMETLKNRFWRIHLPGAAGPRDSIQETIVRDAHVVRIIRRGSGTDLVVKDDLGAVLGVLRSAALEPTGEAEHLSLEQVFLALCENEKEATR